MVSKLFALDTHIKTPVVVSPIFSELNMIFEKIQDI